MLWRAAIDQGDAERVGVHEHAVPAVSWIPRPEHEVPAWLPDELCMRHSRIDHCEGECLCPGAGARWKSDMGGGSQTAHVLTVIPASGTTTLAPSDVPDMSAYTAPLHPELP